MASRVQIIGCFVVRFAPGLVLHVSEVCEPSKGQRRASQEPVGLTILRLGFVQMALDEVLLVPDLEYEGEDDEKLFDDLGVNLLAESGDGVPIVDDRLGV